MRLYILNITKPYSEDEDGYTGEWFDCPVDFEEVKEKLGVKEVEEIEIADYELPFSLTPSMSLWEINGICRQIQEIEGTPVGKELQAIVYKWFQNIEDFLNHKDEICLLYTSQLVTFEELYDVTNPDEPVKVTEHKDITDEGQTVTIKEVPEEPEQPDTPETPETPDTPETPTKSTDAPKTGDTTNIAAFEMCIRDRSFCFLTIL